MLMKGKTRGNYDKWRLAGEDLDYLPHWIKKAGYKAESLLFFAAAPRFSSDALGSGWKVLEWL
jgi:hypothetical protein